ncbi:MAG: hypothetical protein M1839_001776 [Geoglossum umbratile]|nr:MAG: hypothetical protein M1839_001776 [Geoglossum umbratile]
MVVIFVDQLSKCLITISMRDIIIARRLIPLFLVHVFMSDFWNEFYEQTEIVNQYFDQYLQLYINYYQDDWDE